MEDKWVKEVEYILKPKVLHHMLFFITEEKDKSDLTKNRNEFGTYYLFSRVFGWSPGVKRHFVLPNGIGSKIPKGANMFLGISL